jgi:hypothetical protein
VVPCLSLSIICNTISVISFAATRSYIYLDPCRHYIFIISVLYLDIGEGGKVAKAGLNKALLLLLDPLP